MEVNACGLSQGIETKQSGIDNQHVLGMTRYPKIIHISMFLYLYAFFCLTARDNTSVSDIRMKNPTTRRNKFLFQNKLVQYKYAAYL